MLFSCTYCTYRCNLRLDLIKHLFGSHSMETRFLYVCGIKGCLHTFKYGSTFSSFKTHASRKHPNWQDHVNQTNDNVAVVPVSVPAPVADPSTPVDVGPGAVSAEPDPHESIEPDPSMYNLDCDTNTAISTSSSSKKAAALFILTFQERYKLSQKAINFAVGTVNTIVDITCEGIRSSLQESYPDAEISECFDNRENPFADLDTEYMQSKYYREEFGLVEPVTVTLGTTYEYERRGTKRRLVEKLHIFQYVPLIENLQWILQNTELYQEVFKERPSTPSGYLYDFCDGEIFKQHPLFSTEKDALQIVIYYDEVETANPLGSYRGKHKLGMFYYLLGNIAPNLRSTLKGIQLIACVTTENLEKYGFEMVLAPFIKDANALSNGVVMTIRGVQKTVKGAVLFALADTLAAHSMGGFKVGVGFSFRKCRMCLATRDQLSTKFRARDFTMRTPEMYNYHCALLDGPLSYEDSVTYGVNFYSPLNDLDNFHVVNQLPQDIMHILLEGVIPYELSLLLTFFIANKKYFTIDHLNDSISCYDYSVREANDKPSPVRPQVISLRGARLSQTSAQMWNLAINLPLMIGNKIPLDDEHWECFLLLLDILQLCTTKFASAGQAGFLEALIHDHHHLFIRCYPEANITPKMHYMVHFPRQIIRTGPLINTWCMRMEGKNSYFKQVAQISNFKNVPYTVAKRHQRLLCAYLHGGAFFDTEVEYCPAKAPKQLCVEDQDIITKVNEITGNSSLSTALVHRPKWIIHMGVKYTFTEYVLIGWQDDDLPAFGQIQCIVVIEGIVLFTVTKYHTLGIDRHFHSYVINRSDEVELCSLLELVYYHPFRAHNLNGHQYITFRSHIENVFGV